MLGTSVASKFYEIRAHLRNEIRLAERKKIKEREEMERMLSWLVRWH